MYVLDFTELLLLLNPKITKIRIQKEEDKNLCATLVLLSFIYLRWWQINVADKLQPSWNDAFQKTRHFTEIVVVVVVCQNIELW